ncbi:MAG: DUF1893 domain-containing protein [Endomicrobium sp.]|nr:DUF1893 domain-containing protein [Endomicrobium sp.]
MKKMKFLRLLLLAAAAGAVVLGCAAKNAKTSVNDLKEMLKSHALIVAYPDGTVKIYDDKGIKPLFKHLESGDFKNCDVYDKVTGKASTLILVYGGAASLYTGILSKEAIPVLEKYGIKYRADKIVDYIINVTGDDKCPMEKTVTDIEDPQQAFEILKERFGQ